MKSIIETTLILGIVGVVIVAVVQFVIASMLGAGLVLKAFGC